MLQTAEAREQWRVARAQAQKFFDESKHPRDEHGRWTDGGGGDEPAGYSDDAEDKPEAEKLLLVSEFPSQEKLDHWNEGLTARSEELAKQGQAGNAEDDQIAGMQSALAKLAQEPDANLQAADAGLNAVYDGNDNNALKAAAFTYIDTRGPQSAPVKVAIISSFGATDHKAGVKVLQQVEQKFASRTDQIEGTFWGDDAATRAIYEEAGFKQQGETEGGITTMVKTELPGGGFTKQRGTLMKAASGVATKLKFDPAQIVYTDEKRKFQLGGQNFDYAGSYQFGTPQIKLYMGQINESNVKGVTAHEIGHRKFDLLMKMHKIQYEVMMKDPGPPPDPNHQYWWGKKGGTDAMMTPTGELRPPYDEKYPIYHEWAKIQNMRPSLEQDDGITEYSKKWWKEWEAQKTSTDIAYHETMAEMSRNMGVMGKHSAVTKPNWRRLYRLQEKVWTENPDMHAFNWNEKPKTKSLMERTTIGGRNATVVYLDDDFVPVDPEESTMAKIVFDDGEVIFVTKTPTPPKTETKRFDPSQARDEHGRWTDGGGSDDTAPESSSSAPAPARKFDTAKVEAKTKANVAKASEKAKKEGKKPLPGNKGEHPSTIASRNPTAKGNKKNPAPPPAYGQPDTASMKLDPERYEHDIGVMQNDDFYQNFRKDDFAGSTDEAVNNIVGQMKDNLKWLYQYADKSTEIWYDGARALVDDRAALWGFNDASIAGVYAALSPTKDWDQNVHIADMLMKTYREQQDHKWDDEMEATAKTLWSPANLKIVAKVKGKTLGELTDPREKAVWIRTYDETHNTRDYREVLPNGALGKFVKNKDGSRSKVVWQSVPAIKNAIIALEADGDIEKISSAMGTAHKVRSFYNNILDPHSANGDVTIDTHAVGAALLRQLSGDHVPVAHNFGNTPETADQPEGWEAVGSSTKTGLSGLYPVYARAYREAAQELGIQPRQLQSAVWVVKRNTFGNLSKKDQEAVESLWHSYHDDKKITLDHTRSEIAKILGLGKHERHYAVDEGGGRRADARELHQPRMGQPDAAVDSRSGARAAGRAAGLEIVRTAEERRADLQGLSEDLREQWRIARIRALKTLQQTASIATRASEHTEWMNECVPEMMGYGKDQIVAVAACMNIWRDVWEETHPDGADDPGPSPPGTDSPIEAEGKHLQLALTRARKHARTLVRSENKQPRTLYARRDLQNVEEFTAWAKAQGFSEVADDLHATVLYSKELVTWAEMGRDARPLTVPADDDRTLEQLGDEGAVVLRFESAALEQRHDEMVENGASHDYDSYKPHVTINYAGSIPDGAEPYRGELVFGPEIFETITVTKEWDESKHPRVPAGGPDGGQFGAGGGGSASESKPSGGGKSKKPAKKEDFDKAGIKIVGVGPREALTIEKWNEHIGIEPEEFKKHFLGGLDGTMTVMASAGNDKIDFVGDISGKGMRSSDNRRSGEGLMVAHYERQIDVKDKTAYSALLKVHEDYRKSGIGKNLLAGNVEMYQKMGLKHLGVTAGLDVGGYAWAKYGYVPDQASWDRLRASLENRVSGFERSSSARTENTVTAESWSDLPPDTQDNVRDEWMRQSYDEFLSNEAQNWRDSGQAKDEAKYRLAEEYTSTRISTGDNTPDWVNEALNVARDHRTESDQPPIPFTNKQIYDAMNLEYEANGDGQDDPDISFDESMLKEPEGFDPDQGTLPGIEPVDPSTLLTKDMREQIIAHMIPAFDKVAEDRSDDMEPPSYLADSIREYQEEYWDSMDDVQRLYNAERYDMAHYEIEPDPDDEPSEDEQAEMELMQDKAADPLLTALRDPNPKAIWRVADHYRGKELLLKQGWTGRLDFSDKESMDRFHEYVGRAKHG